MNEYGRSKVMRDLDKQGFTRVKIKDAAYGARRRLLREMAAEGVVVLVTPINGSYMTYSKADIKP